MQKIKQDYSIHKGNLILVNQFHPYCMEHVRELVYVDQKRTVELNANAATVLEYLLRDIKGEKEIIPVSGYRSIQEQKLLFHNSMIENGEEYTRKYVALPGCSEHHTGLAIDLQWAYGKKDLICPSFPNEGVCKKFRERAAQYGYILRYPKEKEESTGIGYEPWHFRYVGYPHSELMEEYGLSLEEYLEFLKDFKTGSKPLRTEKFGKLMEISYLEKGKFDQMENQLNSIIQISGNNTDGYILTQWRQANEVS